LEQYINSNNISMQKQFQKFFNVDCEKKKAEDL